MFILSIIILISIKVKYHRVDPPMPLEKMRLTITILFKKISNDKKLKELGFEKVTNKLPTFKINHLIFFQQRLIDNVLIDSLKIAGRKYFTDEDRTFSEAERLKLNVQEFLDWTIPSETMEDFKKDSKSTEEILDSLSTAF